MTNSAIGPNASAGKKLKALISSTITISRNTNIPLLVDKVPAVTASFFFCTMLPAIARIPVIGRNLARSIAPPRVRFKNGVSAPKPANAEPLFPPADEYAYSISEKPCAPELFRLSATDGTAAAIPLNTNMAIGVARHTRQCHLVKTLSRCIPIRQR